VTQVCVLMWLNWQAGTPAPTLIDVYVSREAAQREAERRVRERYRDSDGDLVTMEDFEFETTEVKE
jgi:hypothetical protein